jgi:hypothetical protein
MSRKTKPTVHPHYITNYIQAFMTAVMMWIELLFLFMFQLQSWHHIHVGWFAYIAEIFIGPIFMVK